MDHDATVHTWYIVEQHAEIIELAGFWTDVTDAADGAEARLAWLPLLLLLVPCVLGRKVPVQHRPSLHVTPTQGKKLGEHGLGRALGHDLTQRASKHGEA